MFILADGWKPAGFGKGRVCGILRVLAATTAVTMLFMMIWRRFLLLFLVLMMARASAMKSRTRAFTSPDRDGPVKDADDHNHHRQCEDEIGAGLLKKAAPIEAGIREDGVTHGSSILLVCGRRAVLLARGEIEALHPIAQRVTADFEVIRRLAEVEIIFFQD